MSHKALSPYFGLGLSKTIGGPTIDSFDSISCQCLGTTSMIIQKRLKNLFDVSFWSGRNSSAKILDGIEYYAQWML